jgi:hypothetical protein
MFRAVAEPRHRGWGGPRLTSGPGLLRQCKRWGLSEQKRSRCGTRRNAIHASLRLTRVSAIVVPIAATEKSDNAIAGATSPKQGAIEWLPDAHSSDPARLIEPSIHDLELSAKALPEHCNPHEYRVMSLRFELGLAAAGERLGGEPALEAAGFECPAPRRCR